MWTYLKKKDKMSKICAVMKIMCVEVRAEVKNRGSKVVYENQRVKWALRLNGEFRIVNVE